MHERATTRKEKKLVGGERRERRGRERVLGLDRILIYRSFDAGGVLRLKGNELILDDTMNLKKLPLALQLSGRDRREREKVEGMFLRTILE